MSTEIINGIFALAGAFIGAIATLFSTRGQRERRLLRVRYSEQEDLLGRFKASRLDLDFKLNDRTISELFRQTVWVSNEGNRVLEHLELSFQLAFGSSLFEASLPKVKPNDPKTDIEKVGDRSINVSLDFLNPGEKSSPRLCFR